MNSGGFAGYLRHCIRGDVGYPGRSNNFFTHLKIQTLTARWNGIETQKSAIQPLSSYVDIEGCGSLNSDVRRQPESFHLRRGKTLRWINFFRNCDMRSFTFKTVN
jgi:hypothetical protein